ncbi:hypothetical protein E4U24_006536 [Claviceps purpurea]|nr:hypothetical protein E4U24_006536 [Claviceps purpurea]KAG6259010.1 hypothetical protein E4U49_006022 [Claviceps purpurea]
MFTKDEAAALPQVHFYFHKRREPLVPPMMLEYMRLAYLAVIRSGFNPVEIFVRYEQIAQYNIRQTQGRAYRQFDR